MCIRDSRNNHYVPQWYQKRFLGQVGGERKFFYLDLRPDRCLLYTSDAADERSSVDPGGRRIIKKKKNTLIIEL